MARPGTGTVASLASAAMLAATWELTRRRDAARLAADPDQALLTAPLPGRPRTAVGADGTRLAAQVAGPEDAPATVLLLHGWGMGRRYWFHQLRDLATDLRVLTYDHRGHGASQTPWDGDHSIEALARDLDAVAAQLVPAGQPLVVAGHSMGGMTLLAAVAEQLPVVERMHGALLLNTGAGRLTANVFAGLGVAETIATAVGTRALRSRIPVPRRTTPVSSRLIKATAHGAGANPAAVALTEQLFLDCPADARAAFGASLAALELRHVLPEVRVPTTVVTGTRDRLTPQQLSRELAERIPDAELVTLRGIGHQSSPEAPHEITTIIRRRVEAALAAARPRAVG